MGLAPEISITDDFEGVNRFLWSDDDFREEPKNKLILVGEKN